MIRKNINDTKMPPPLSVLLGFEITDCKDSNVAAMTTQNKVADLRKQINSLINEQCPGFVSTISSSLRSKESVKSVHRVINNTIKELSDPNKSNFFSKEEDEETQLLMKKFREKKIIISALKILSEINVEFLNSTSNFPNSTSKSSLHLFSHP